MIPTHHNIRRSPSPPIPPQYLKPVSQPPHIPHSPQPSQPLHPTSPTYQNRKVVYVPQNVQNPPHNPEHIQLNHQIHHQNQQKRQDFALNQPKPPQSRLQYIPYENYYIDYEQQQVLTTVMVPVQRKKINYYAVEHVTDFLPQPTERTVVDMVPEQKVNMRLKYVPVQTKIVHYPKNDGQFKMAAQKMVYSGQPNHLFAKHYQQKIQTSPYSSELVKQRRRTTAKTNYVTSDNYVPMDYNQMNYNEDKYIRTSEKEIFDDD